MVGVGWCWGALTWGAGGFESLGPGICFCLSTFGFLVGSGLWSLGGFVARDAPVQSCEGCRTSISPLSKLKVQVLDFELLSRA